MGGDTGPSKGKKKAQRDTKKKASRKTSVLKKSPDVAPDSPKEHQPSGILPCDLIEDLKLIDPETWEKEGLRATSYNLRFGTKYYPCDNSDVDDPIDVPATYSIGGYESILFETKEIVDFSKHNNIVGRFGLKMSYALQGLILQVGPQVEPGYRGRLFGLLYNSTNVPVILRPDSEFLTIEFSLLSRDPDLTRLTKPEAHKEECLSLKKFLESRIGDEVMQTWDNRVNVLKTMSEKDCDERHKKLTIEITDKKGVLATIAGAKWGCWAILTAIIAIIIMIVISVFWPEIRSFFGLPVNKQPAYQDRQKPGDGSSDVANGQQGVSDPRSTIVKIGEEKELEKEKANKGHPSSTDEKHGEKLNKEEPEYEKNSDSPLKPDSNTEKPLSPKHSRGAK